MRVPGLVVAALAVGCQPSGGGTRSPRTAAGHELEPAILVASEGAACAAARVPVRFRADDAYRAQHVDWQRDAARLVEWANRTLGATACIELDARALETWPGRQGDTMAGMLLELEALDPGDDVVFVIGLTDALPAATSDLARLGRARPLGRHIVLRGLDGSREAIALGDALGRYPAGKRRAVLDRRGRHKQTVMLLHQIAHSLGAVHVTDERSVMTPTYSAEQRSFGPQEAALLRAVAGVRAAGDLAAFKMAVQQHLDAKPWDGWNVDELAALEADLVATEAAEQDGLGPDVRPEDRESFQAARRLLHAAQPHEAWELVERLLEIYPRELAIEALACQVGAATRSNDTRLLKRCEAEAESEEIGEMAVLISVIDWKMSAGGRDVALRLLARAAAAPAASATSAEWLKVAKVAQSLGEVQIAEVAAGRAGAGGKSVVSWATSERARWAVPRGAVKPDKEMAVIEGLRAALKQVYASQYGAAIKTLVALENEHGDLAGARVVRCDLSIRRKKYPEARTYCERALALDKDAAWAHYLLGLLDQRDKKPDAAIAHLERAVQLIPDVKDPWQILKNLYQRAGKDRQLRELGALHQARFARPL